MMTRATDTPFRVFRVNGLGGKVTPLGFGGGSVEMETGKVSFRHQRKMEPPLVQMAWPVT
jgi:hypothetical protein